MAAAMAGGKGKGKKKWSKGKVREKVANKVLYDQETYERLLNEVPKVINYITCLMAVAATDAFLCMQSIDEVDHGVGDRRAIEGERRLGACVHPRTGRGRYHHACVVAPRSAHLHARDRRCRRISVRSGRFRQAFLCFSAGARSSCS